MTSLKIINQKELKSWAKEFFLEHNYKMIDVSDKQPTFRKALATGKIIPLCHPLPIDHTATKIIMNEDDFSLEVYCVVSAHAKTGVEMEAIMGVNTALITIYDLSKIVNPDLRIEGIKLLVKQGGKSGLWLNPGGLPDFLSELF